MTEEEVTEKFHGNVKAVLSEDRARNLVTTVQNLETVDNVRKLASLLTLS
jgi:translation initiation factor 1 (eIF-1/SUI1)